jgi:hypothetical protein
MSTSGMPPLAAISAASAAKGGAIVAVPTAPLTYPFGLDLFRDAEVV